MIIFRNYLYGGDLVLLRKRNLQCLSNGRFGWKTVLIRNLDQHSCVISLDTKFLTMDFDSAPQV